jgi:hypothetical protein
MTNQHRQPTPEAFVASTDVGDQSAKTFTVLRDEGRGEDRALEKALPHQDVSDVRTRRKASWRQLVPRTRLGIRFD